jgi:IS30 family transposase
MNCLPQQDITVQKKSKVRHLDERERNKIEGFKQLKMSNRAIAKLLGRSHST